MLTINMYSGTLAIRNLILSLYMYTRTRTLNSKFEITPAKQIAYIYICIYINVYIHVDDIIYRTDCDPIYDAVRVEWLTPNFIRAQALAFYRRPWFLWPLTAKESRPVDFTVNIYPQPLHLTVVCAYLTIRTIPPRAFSPRPRPMSISRRRRPQESQYNLIHMHMYRWLCPL